MGFASSPTRLAALDPLAGLLEKARIRDSRHLKKDEATLCLEGYENFCALLCETCVLCQQAKPGRTRLPGLLQPLPVSTAWQIISLDFVEGLPRAQSANCILAYKYFRPYKILSRVGQVSYRLPTKFFSNSSYVSCFATKTNCWLFSPGYPIGSGCS